MKNKLKLLKIISNLVHTIKYKFSKNYRSECNKERFTKLMVTCNSIIEGGD